MVNGISNHFTQATDADATSPNNEVSYSSITRTDSSDPHSFDLTSATGQVSVLASNLNYEMDASYRFTITARDGGDPANVATATLNITIVVRTLFNTPVAKLLYHILHTN